MEIVRVVNEEKKSFYRKIYSYESTFIKFLLKEHIIKGLQLLNGYIPKFCFIFVVVDLNAINIVNNMNNNIKNYKTFFIIIFANFPRRIWGLWSINKKNILMTGFPKYVRRIWGTLVK